MILVVGCQSDPFSRPVNVPKCIHNEDNSAECSNNERTWQEFNLTNYVCTPIRPFGDYQKYVLELEERLLKCEASQ